jgi:hypothetical protein
MSVVEDFVGLEYGLGRSFVCDRFMLGVGVPGGV